MSRNKVCYILSQRAGFRCCKRSKALFLDHFSSRPQYPWPSLAGMAIELYSKL
jgi:hypothetical protein